MAKAIKAAVIVAGIATGVGILTGAIAGGSAFTAFGASLFSAGTVGAFFARQFVTSLVLGALSSALTKSPSGGIGGTTVTSRSSVAPRQVIYGRTRVGGTIVYMEGTDSNKYLHSVIVFSGHEIDGFEKLYFNDEELIVDSPSGNVTTGKYANKVKIALVNGTSSQAAFADLVAASDSKWTANHRLLGCSAMYVRLEYDQDVFTSGVPNVSVVLRGKKVYDPRTGLTAWSQNPALCLNDYLTNADYGLGCSASEINTSALITAANICDEDVPLAAGGTENTYEINGAFQTSAAPEQIINSILSSMIGKAIWSGGKWRILAGAYYTPTLVFDEDDMRGGIRVQTNVSRRENFNSIKGTHISVEENYIPTDFPAVIGDGTTNATMANYVAQDNGEVVYKTILLPFTTSATMAQRISKIELERARQQITVSLPLKLVGLKANVGDVILLDNERMGWIEKPFEVVSMGVTYTEEIGVDLELRETAAEVFDWNSGIDQKDYDPAPNTNLPNPFSVTPPTNLVVTATSQVNNDGTIQPLFQVTWTASVDQSVVNYEIQWKRGAYGSLPAETVFNSALLAGASYTISGVITSASYEIRVRSINSLGVRSDWLSTVGISNSGDAIPPAAPTGLTVTSYGYRSCYLKWVNPADDDYFQTIIYSSFTNNSSTAVEVGRLSGTSQTYSGLIDDTTYYVWLKAVDYSGNVSGFNTGTNAGTPFTTGSEIGAGQTGETGPRSATGYLYYSTALTSPPSSPTLAGYNFITGTFSTITSGWSVTPSSTVPVVDKSYYAVRYSVTEVTFDGAQTINKSAVYESQNFDGIITFTNIQDGVNATVIDGGQITTGTIVANRIGSGTSTQSGGEFALGSTTQIAGVYGTGIFKRTTNTGFGVAGVMTSYGSGSAGVVGAVTGGYSGTFGTLGYYTNSSYTQTYGVGGLGGFEYGVTGRYYAGGSTAFTVPTYEGRLGLGTAAVQAYKQSSGDYFNLLQSGWLAVAYRGGTASVGIGQLPSGYAVYGASGAGKGYFVDGTGPFTGVHDGVVESSFNAEVGDILVDVEFLHAVDVSNTIVKMQKSTFANQKGVVGVFIEKFNEPPFNWNPTIPKYPAPKPTPLFGEETDLPPVEEEITQVPNPEYYDIGDYLVVNVNALGEGMINVCGQGGDIEIGDLIVTSDIAGKGMKQADDLVRNITVAKSRQNVTFSGPTEVKQIACIYVSG